MFRPHHSQARRRPRLLLALLTTLAVLATIGGCESGGDGDGDGGAGAANAGPEHGSVAVVLTDGPVDPRAFEHIYVTYLKIILIGEPGQVTIFEGRETVDLRDLEDVSKLATVGREVPAGFYSKIRLEIEEIELVPTDGTDPILLSKPPNKLPPKIDLNPRESFEVRSKKLLLLQIDIVAGDSIHIVETGKEDKFQFRPVVFVDILTGPALGKLVLLDGVVENVDDDERTFDLCGSHPVSRPKDGERQTEYPDDDGDDDETNHDDDHCVEIVTRDTDNKTSYFEQDGSPAGFDAVDEGDDASVLGRFRREEDDDEDLVFVAEVVQLGNPLAVDGSAASIVGLDDRFLIDLDPGQPITSVDPVAVLLQQGSKVFTRRGLPLAPSKIQVDDPVRVTGVFDRTDDEFKAAFVMVDVMAVDQDRIQGLIIEEPEADGALLEVLTEEDPDPVCVEVPDDAKVFRISVDEGAGEGTAEAIDRSELDQGERVSVFGERGAEPDDCFVAETVISFGDDASIAPLPSLDGGGAGVPVPSSVAAFAEEESEEPEAGSSAAVVEAYEIGPRRIEAGLIWVKLPGDEDPDAASR